MAKIKKEDTVLMEKKDFLVESIKMPEIVPGIKGNAFQFSKDHDHFTYHQRFDPQHRMDRSLFPFHLDEYQQKKKRIFPNLGGQCWMEKRPLARMGVLYGRPKQNQSTFN